MIRDVLMDGIADVEIRGAVLGANEVQDCSINELIAYVENKETARNANAVSRSSGLSAVSSYKRSNFAPKPLKSNDTQTGRNDAPSAADRAKTAPCPDCGKPFNLFEEKAQGWNRKPFQCCNPCWRRRRQMNEKPSQNVVSAESERHLDAFGQISSVILKVNQPALNSSNKLLLCDLLKHSQQ